MRNARGRGGRPRVRVAGGIAIASSWLLSLAAGPALAQNNDLEKVGALLALPVLTNLATDRSTISLVTNVSPQSLVLRVHMVDGDGWLGASFACFVSASETTIFAIEPTATGLQVRYECTNSLTFASEARVQVFDMIRGIMVVALEHPATGDTTNVNAIFGEARVVDFAQGMAFKLGAISFQGIFPGAGGVAERAYQFDGQEYSNFPAALAANFISPTSAGDVEAELILFSLDGTAGIAPGPSAFLSITFFDDDERQFSSALAFDCFTVVPLDAIDARFERPALGSDGGHLFLTPEIASQSEPTHDFLFDGGIGFDQLRRIPVHGWLVHSFSNGATIVSGGSSLVESAAWGETLSQSNTALVPYLGDVVTFNAAW